MWWSQLVGAVEDSLADIFARLGNFLPDLLAAIVILVAGWLVVWIIAWIVDKLLRAVQLPALFQAVKLEDLLKKAETKLDGVGLLSAAIKWILYLVVLIAALAALKIPAVSSFLDQILAYVPDVIAAGGILLVGVVLALFLGKVVSGVVKAAGLGHASLLGAITRYAIVIFTLIAVLIQLHLDVYLFPTLFTGIVAFLAIAGGIAFGLGGKDTASEIVEKVKKELSS